MRPNKGIAVDTFVRPLAEVDRAMLDGEDEGFVKIHVKKGTDKILGATIVAAHAGEMISELTSGHGGQVGTGDDFRSHPSLPDSSGGDQAGCGRVQSHPTHPVCQDTVYEMAFLDSLRRDL